MDGNEINLWEEISYDEIQEMIDKTVGQDNFDFGDYVGKIVNGEVPFSVQQFCSDIISGIQHEFMQEKEWYLYLLLLAITGAIITNFSKLLQGKKVATMAFYMVYMLFFSVLSISFGELSAIAESTLTGSLNFVKVLAPAYFISLSVVEGSVAGGVYYQFTLIVILVVDFVLVKVALPASQIYFLLEMANQLSEEEMFSKMAKMIRNGVRFLIKTMFGVVMGINVVQGLIVPVAAEVKSMAVVRISNSIPGIGGMLSSAASTIIGAGSLVKNAIGVAGMLALFFICALPMLKLFVGRFLYQLVTIIVQPVCDKRILKCMEGVAEAVGMQIYAVGTSCMLFVISIAIISAMT